MQNNAGGAQSSTTDPLEECRQLLQKQLKMQLHELKNLVASLVSSAQLLTRESLNDERKEKMKANILNAADRFSALTRELLAMDFSEKSIVEIDIPEMVKHIIDSLSEIFVSKKIQFHTDYKGTRPVLHANQEELSQAFYNILLNACEAFGEDGGSIEVSYVDQGDKFSILIEDNGPGIPSEVLPKIFDIFTFGKENGNGYGLYIAKEVVERSGGSLSVVSSPEQGTTFNMTFSLVTP